MSLFSRTSKKQRFLPTLEQITSLASELPDPAEAENPVKTLFLKIGSKNIPIDFTRVLTKGTDGKKYRWVYEGRILV